MKKYLLTLVFLLILPQTLLAATRLGLHHTQEELAIWRQRAASGPYRATGDVRTNSPGDWLRILGKANTFLANYTTSTYEIWPGPSDLTQCFVVGAVQVTLGEDAQAAALAYLLCDGAPGLCPSAATAYRDAVLAKLLDQASRAGTDFSDNPPWCPLTHNSPNQHLQMTIWLTRIVGAYDFIRDGISAPNRATIDAWFLKAGNYLEANYHGRIAGPRFPNRKSDSYVSVGQGQGGSNGNLYFGGPTFWEFSRAWENQAAAQVRTFSEIGVLLDNTALKNEGKRFCREYIKYGLFYTNTPYLGTPTTTSGELSRWDSFNPTVRQASWAYPASTLSDCIAIADAFARIDDDELFNYSTTEGLQGTEGGPKTLKNAVINHAKLMDHQIQRYATDVAGEATDPDYLIDGECESDTSICNPNGAAFRSVRDIGFALGNGFWRDSYLRSVYMRTAANMPGYPASPETGGYDAWGGTASAFPGMLFMYGDMADNQTAHPGLDPYNLTSDTTPPDPPTNLRVVGQ